jgi:hypothetical protein
MWRALAPRLVALLLTLVPAAASAQETPLTWPARDPSRLATVYILDAKGAETAGQLLRFERDAVVVLVNGLERRFEAADVSRIQRRGDSLRNGAIAGAIVGAALGVLSAGISDCPGDESGDGCPGFRALAVPVSAALYAAVGTGIDALIPGRTTVYVAPVPPGSTLSRGSPKAGARIRVGVNLTFGW